MTTKTTITCDCCGGDLTNLGRIVIDRDGKLVFDTTDRMPMHFCTLGCVVEWAKARRVASL